MHLLRETSVTGCQILFLLLVLAGCFHGICAQCFNEVDPIPTEGMLIEGLENFFQASNHFGLHLFRSVNHTTDVFLSPFSLWSTLVLVYLGAKRTTERELQAVLGLKEMDKVVVAHSYHILQKWFETRMLSSSSTFSVINQLFMHDDIMVRQCFLNFVGQEITFIDFHTDPELARRTINIWIRQQTNGNIRKILPPQSINHYTKLMVTSAMHFKGKWLQPFHPYATTSRPFYSSSGRYVMVDMMVVKDTYQYATSEELQCNAIELPYVGKSLTMVVMLPKNKIHGLQILINSLTPSRLSNLTEEMFPQEIIVKMPRFQMDHSLQMENILYKMGLRDLLNSMKVDLSGFTGYRDLEVSSVRHKAYIAINEQGTEASAGTVFAVTRSARPRRLVTFVVDRPFVFYIRENFSGSILFMGVVHHPEPLRFLD